MRTEDVATVVARVREQAPLVHCITNAVTVNLVANVLLACGAKPMMTDNEREAPEMVTLADALLVNLGTPSSDTIAAAPATSRVAAAEGTPWVLDPVGIGAGSWRTEVIGRILDDHPAVVRGNASEVITLAGMEGGGRGPESTAAVDDALDAARRVVARGVGAVSISGPVDLVTDGSQVAEVHGGDVMLTRITGAGCSLGGLVAGCAAVAEPLPAAVAAHAWYAVAAERAAARSQGPGSFAVALLDELYAVDAQELVDRVVLR